MAQSDLITKKIVARKQFTYAKKGVSLDFTLRTDNSSELKAFKDCMIEAIEDIDVILEGMKN